MFEIQMYTKVELELQPGETVEDARTRLVDSLDGNEAICMESLLRSATISDGKVI
jgi:hypothetical protein